MVRQFIGLPLNRLNGEPVYDLISLMVGLFVSLVNIRIITIHRNIERLLLMGHLLNENQNSDRKYETGKTIRFGRIAY